MRLRRSALSFLVLTGLCLGSLSPARAAEDPTPAAGPADATAPLVTPGDPDTSLSEAVSASLDAAEGSVAPAARDELAAAQEAFRPKSDAELKRATASGSAPDATMALRDLAVADAAGSATGRNRAYASNQRPWNDDDARYKTACRANVCVHWLSKDNPLYAADPNAATDAYAALALQTLVDISATYVAAGYRRPKPDGPRRDNQPMYGGTDATDIYLSDVGDSRLYGYCTVDIDDNGNLVYARDVSRPGAADLPAFCVLDNDYSRSQFPSHTPKQNLQVTAAHEYFHAVQFGYDFLEDRWFMEATATWAEDEVYDSVNDNVQYLRVSQLRYPGASLDDFNAVYGGLHYGDWIYFRYLTEHLAARTGRLPNLVRQMWERADSTRGPDLYSLQAVVRTLGARGASFPRVFGQYVAANRHPRTAYAEGRANRYPSSRAKRTATLRPSARRASGSVTVNHLASATVRFVPRRLPKRTTKLGITVDMASRRTGSVAVAIIYLRSGRILTRLVGLDRAGNGRLTTPFSSRRVAAVELSLVNASTRFKRCSGQVDGFSCGGVPVDNRMTEKYAVRVK